MKKGLRYILLFLIMLTISAYSVTAVCNDDDLDTYGIGCAKEDCNDNDFFVNPGRSEMCDNGIDDNCNGEVDEEPCVSCKDSDGDDYGNPGSSFCDNSETDCNDADKTINPGTTENTFEICIDGIDNNCNGLIDQDDAGCSGFYSSPGTGAQVTSGCTISNPTWMNTDAEIINFAISRTEVFTIAQGVGCKDIEVTISIQNYETGIVVDETETFFGEFPDEEGNALDNYIVYQTIAPTEAGNYVFIVTSDAGSVTSDILIVEAGSAADCTVQWDCSAIPYGDCKNGMKSRDICPGNEDLCCIDEMACACEPVFPAGTCDEYAYANPAYQKSCAAIGGGSPKQAAAEEEEEYLEEPESELPWLLIGIIILTLAGIGGAIYYLTTKGPAVQAPAQVINYVKAARAKNIPDASIKEALQKSGWKPEQIKAAFKAK